jgi:hypothetical protein
MVKLLIDGEYPGRQAMAGRDGQVTAMTGTAGVTVSREDDLVVLHGTTHVDLDENGHNDELDLDKVSEAGDPIIYRVVVGQVRRYLDLSDLNDEEVSWAETSIQRLEGPAPDDWAPVQGPPGVVAATGIATYDPSTQTVDVPGLLAGAQDATPAVEKAEDGDLWLAAGMYTSGEVKGGVIRRVTSIDTIWNSAPAVAPTDVAVGTAHRVKWDATITQPDIQSHSFGPRGVWSLEGVHELSADQTAVYFEPVMALDFMAIGNTPGQDRIQVPAWGYIGGRWRFADAGTVTYSQNDTNSGGAEFVDTPVWLTRNNGIIDGVTNESAYASFFSAGVIGGNTSLHRKIGFAVKDLEATEPSGFDEPAGSVAQQLGLFVPHLAFGDENFGVWNESATAEPPQAVTVGASTTIPRGATTYHLTSTALAINTAAPVIPDGQPGERITLHNVGAYPIGLAGEAAAGGLPAIAASNLAQWAYLIPGATLTLQWTGTVWTQVAVNSPKVLLADGQLVFQSLGDTHARLAIGELSGGGVIEWGGGLGAVDVRLGRTAAGLLGFNLGRFDTLPANRMLITETIAPAAPAADHAVIFARDSGGKTQLCVRFPTGAIQVLSTEP